MSQSHEEMDQLLEQAIAAMRATPTTGEFPADLILASLRQEACKAPGLNIRARRSTLVLRLAASLALVMGLVALLVMMRAGDSVARGDAIDAFRSARSMRVRIITHVPDQPPVITRAMFLGRGHYRFEMGNTVAITDDSRGLMLTLDLDNKTALLQPIEASSATTRPALASEETDWFAELQQIPRGKGRRVGSKDLEGRPADGFAVDQGERVITVWADPKTLQPLRLEIALHSNGRDVPLVDLDQIELDPPMPDSLFSVDAPAGFALRRASNRVRQDEPDERDLVEFFREYATLNGGRFPQAVGGNHWAGALSGLSALQQPTTQPGPSEQLIKFVTLTTRAAMFVNTLDKHAWTYAGGGKLLGDAKTPIFWYRGSASGAYRAIYGDLRVASVTSDQVPASGK